MCTYKECNIFICVTRFTQRGGNVYFSPEERTTPTTGDRATELTDWNQISKPKRKMYAFFCSLVNEVCCRLRNILITLFAVLLQLHFTLKVLSGVMHTQIEFQVAQTGFSLILSRLFLLLLLLLLISYFVCFFVPHFITFPCILWLPFQHRCSIVCRHFLAYLSLAEFFRHWFHFIAWVLVYLTLCHKSITSLRPKPSSHCIEAKNGLG